MHADCSVTGSLAGLRVRVVRVRGREGRGRGGSEFNGGFQRRDGGRRACAGPGRVYAFAFAREAEVAAWLREMAGVKWRGVTSSLRDSRVPEADAAFSRDSDVHLGGDVRARVYSIRGKQANDHVSLSRRAGWQ
jgi:hypothetical protein